MTNQLKTLEITTNYGNVLGKLVFLTLVIAIPLHLWEVLSVDSDIEESTIEVNDCSYWAYVDLAEGK